MKRFGWILLFSMLATPAWAARKITVDQLKETLVSLQQAKKSDADTASRLKEVELSEELTRATLNNLMLSSPGPLTTEQIYVLEASSAMLAPPPSDLPALASPDIAAQKAIMAKAIDYVVKSYMQNPRMTTSKTTYTYPHFDASDGKLIDTMEKMNSHTSRWSITDGMPTHTETVEFDKETEKDPIPTADPNLEHFPPGFRGHIPPASVDTTGPILSVILQQAAESNELKWQRWEQVGGANAAVFSFAVDKSHSLYQVDYCCFAAGNELDFNDVSSLGGIQVWKHFKAKVGFHGQFFIDPGTGSILRVIMQADFSPSDYVHREDTRVDYGPVSVAGKTYFVPVDSFTLNDVVSPVHDHYKLSYYARKSSWIVKYSDYQLADAHTQAQK